LIAHARLAFEQPFDVPLIDKDTGEVFVRSLVGTLDLLACDAEGRLVVVDLKTSARKYTDLQGLAPAVDLRLRDGDERRRRPGRPLRFDVLTKTRQLELHHYRTQCDRAANVLLFRRVAEILGAIELGVFVPNPGVAVQGLSVPEPVLGVEVGRRGAYGRGGNAR
jgi:hypothetical protein